MRKVNWHSGFFFFSEEKEYIICSTIYWAPSHPIYHSRECRDESLALVRVHTDTHTQRHTLPNQKRRENTHQALAQNSYQNLVLSTPWHYWSWQLNEASTFWFSSVPVSLHNSSISSSCLWLVLRWALRKRRFHRTQASIAGGGWYVGFFKELYSHVCECMYGYPGFHC